MTALDEQETTVTQLRNGDTRVWTANPVHIRALNKRVEEGRASRERQWHVDGVVEAAEYVIPNAEFDPLKGFKTKRKPLTEDQRAALADRLTAARQK
jgi:hypothetical protein